MLTETTNGMHRIRVMSMLAALGAAALALAPHGISAYEAYEAYEPPEREGQPAAEEVLDLDAEAPHVISDARILAAIEARLAESDELSALKIDTDVRDGDVYLRGEVAREAQRELASEFATATVGVRAVFNELEVQDDQGVDPDSHNEDKE